MLYINELKSNLKTNKQKQKKIVIVMIKLGYFQAVFKRKIQTNEETNNNNNTACVVDKPNPEAKIVRRRVGRYWCEALAGPFFRVVRENVDFAEPVQFSIENKKQ